MDERFAILVCFTISNSDSNQSEFSYLTKFNGLNFDGRPLKKIGFCKQCFDKLYALLK